MNVYVTDDDLSAYFPVHGGGVFHQQDTDVFHIHDRFAAAVFTGCVDGKEAIATFGSSTVITMVSMYIVAAGLSRTQMIKKISGTLLKVTNGSFTKILATYIIATCILGQLYRAL